MEEAQNQELEQAKADLNKPNHEKIIDMIVKKDDITWKTIIMELINSNKMDPWNIDIRLLTREYLSTVKQMKQHDFRVSGKIILAAAMLLKLKSVRLLTGDMNELDRLFGSTQEEESDDDLGLVDEILPNSIKDIEMHKLIPRTPQPRKRKVSMYDLVEALEKALEVKERRIDRKFPTLEVEIPKKKKDVSLLMRHLYERIMSLFSKRKKEVYFEDLTPSDSKEDMVITFIPLLHLTNQGKIDLEQEKHFGPIEVRLNKTKINQDDEIDDEMNEDKDKE